MNIYRRIIVKILVMKITRKINILQRLEDDGSEALKDLKDYLSNTMMDLADKDAKRGKYNT